MPSDDPPQSNPPGAGHNEESLTFTQPLILFHWDPNTAQLLNHGAPANLLTFSSCCDWPESITCGRVSANHAFELPQARAVFLSPALSVLPHFCT
jgi:hypothetical protein